MTVYDSYNPEVATTSVKKVSIENIYSNIYSVANKFKEKQRKTYAVQTVCYVEHFFNLEHFTKEIKT